MRCYIALVLALLVTAVGGAAFAQQGCEVTVPTAFRLLDTQSSTAGPAYPARTRVRAIAFGSATRGGARSVRVAIDTAEGWIYLWPAQLRGCPEGSIAARPGDVVRAPAQPSPAPVCAPGTRVGCACPNGGRGVQTCNADGSGFESCRCLPAPHEQVAGIASTPSVQMPPPVAAVAPPIQAPPRRRWYGWETLLQDGGALALLSIGRATDAELVSWSMLGGAIAFALGAPVTHWRHGHVARGFGSLTYRVLVPVLGTAVGWGIGLRVTDDPTGQALVITLVGGAAIASAVILDAAVWSFDDPPSPRRSAPRATLGAALVPIPGGAVATVAGAM